MALFFILYLILIIKYECNGYKYFKIKEEESKLIKIEFFHDVICSFCFPMSARMHRVKEKFSQIEITHRSFALGWEAEDFIRNFGSREAVKPEVLTHWVHANENDDEHRFNIEGMHETDFLFPTSKQGLKAAKAAGLVGGEEAYWEVFDKIQIKLFVENKNIEDVSILEEAVRETSISFEDWKVQFEDKETEDKVIEDIKRAKDYGIRSVPSLIINEKYLIPGAQSQESIERAIRRILDNEGNDLI